MVYFNTSFQRNAKYNDQIAEEGGSKEAGRESQNLVLVEKAVSLTDMKKE